MLLDLLLCNLLINILIFLYYLYNYFILSEKSKNYLLILFYLFYLNFENV